MTLQQLEIIFAIWCLFGVIGIILDLTDKKNRREYKDANVLNLFLYIIGYILLGVFVFRWAVIEFVNKKSTTTDRLKIKPKNEPIIETTDQVIAHMMEEIKSDKTIGQKY